MTDNSLPQNRRPFELSTPAHVSFAAADRVEPGFDLVRHMIENHAAWSEDEARQITDRQLKVPGAFPSNLHQALRSLTLEASDALHKRKLSESFAVSACLTRGLPSLQREADALEEAKRDLDRLALQPGVDVELLLIEREGLDDLRLTICAGDCRPKTVNLSLPEEQFQWVSSLGCETGLGIAKWQVVVLAVALALSEQDTLPDLLRNAARSTWARFERRVTLSTRKAQLAVEELSRGL